MTLKEKFKCAVEIPLISTELNKMQRLAEDFAIGFALWKETIEQDDNGMYYGESRAHVSRKNPVTIKQLLEIYKNETTNK